MRRKTKTLVKKQVWIDMKIKGKKGYLLSEFKRDIILGFLLGAIMHYRVGVNINDYLTMEFLARAIIYTSIYSLGSLLYAIYTWISLERKYS